MPQVIIMRALSCTLLLRGAEFGFFTLEFCTSVLSTVHPSRSGDKSHKV